MAESQPSKITFCYTLGKKHIKVISERSSSVLEALLTDSDFQQAYEKNAKKDLIIKRKKPNIPYYSISIHFPCSLLENQELLEICFVTADQKGHDPDTKKCDQTPEELISFLVRTTGREGLKHTIMQNKNLKEVDLVCVVAVKGETIKKALRRDGRFAKNLFTRDFALEDDDKNITKMKTLVDALNDHKQYSVVLNSGCVMPDSQEFQDDPSQFEPDTADSDQESTVSDSKPSAKALLVSVKKMATTTKSKCTDKRRRVKNIPNTEEILKILRAQFKDLVKQLKVRENFKTMEEVEQFFREEFSKETQCFSEIKTLKRLMDLSASVCQVQHDNQAIGSGFLLFERFILTNAHVITDHGKLLDKLSVAFGFEDLSTTGKQFAVKTKPLAYEYVSTPQIHVDFAVLELQESTEALPPPLLEYYYEPPTRGGVSIIGYPDCGVKKMDTCLITERINQEQAVKEHISKNVEYLEVILETFFTERKKRDETEIEYNSCFFHGSSGSPVFDEHCNLIGMHTGGYVYGKRTSRIDSIIEYALPLLPILVSTLRQTKHKYQHVWNSISAAQNTALVMRLAGDKTYKPELGKSYLTHSPPWINPFGLTSEDTEMVEA